MLKLTDKEYKDLRTLAGLSTTKFLDERLNNRETRRSLIRSISQVLVAEANGFDNSAEDYTSKVDAAMKNTKSAETLFAESMATALVVGYFQSLNNDVATEEPEFGFAGLSVPFNTMVGKYLAELTPAGEVAKALEVGLHVKLRSCDGKSYFDNELWKADIETLIKLVAADIDDGYNKKMLDALKKNSDIMGAVDRYKPDIEALYELLFADSFGIERYKGVLIGGGKFLTIEDGKHEAIRINEGPATLSKFARRVYEKINGKVYISDKRQFDYDEIFQHYEVVYFPRKILEYALGRESTLNITTNYYKSSDYALSWELYYSKYVAVNVEAILYRGAYKALEKVLRDKKSIELEFRTPEFMAVARDYDEYVMESLEKADVMDKVGKLLGKLVRSMKSAYILTKYPYLAGKIAAINFRLCMEPNLGGLSAEATASSYLFKDLVAENDSETFTPPIDITATRRSKIGVVTSSRIIEYQYDINPMLTKAEPLFGYTIQRLNQKKGRSAGWDNILIGQSLSGKELYASATSDIPMQKYFTHNIIAGSRSGKGVMTMNILANALAAGKPVFYLDRKPDMASMLYDLSKGGQFIVNGGLYQAEFDNCKCFSEDSGDALSAWREIGKPFLDANPRIAELFGAPGQGYYSVIGDYIYFRAFMFCLGICVLRTKLSGYNDSVRNKVFGGDNGLVLVVDELTGMQSSISRIFSTIQSKMVQSALNLGEADKVIEKRDKLEREIAVQEQKVAEATKESARMQAEAKIAELKTQIASLVDEQGVYASTLFQKICESYKALIDNKVAGFVNKEFDYSDIFVLGQILDAGYYATSLKSANAGSLSPVFFPLTASKSDYYSAYKGADIIRSFLEELGQEDWFLGRNPAYNYGRKLDNPLAVQCLDEDGNWGYFGAHSCNEIRLVEDGIFGQPILFKPYLVLNNSAEANPPMSGKSNITFQYVAQCAKRVMDNAGGIDLWETVRLKHLAPGVRELVTAEDKHYNELDAGIGFKGLIEDTLKTIKSKDGASVGSIDDYIASVLCKSGDIADYVADKMGYKKETGGWKALIYDLSPQGLFSFVDMWTAVMTPEKYTDEFRLPLYAKLGLLGGESVGVQQDDFSDGSFDDRFGDFDSFVGSSGAEDSATQSFGAAAFEESTSVPHSSAAEEMASAADQMFGSSSSPSDVNEAGSRGSSETVPPKSDVNLLRELWNNACALVNVAVGIDESGYQYTDDDIDYLCNIAFELLQQYAREDGVSSAT